MLVILGSEARAEFLEAARVPLGEAFEGLGIEHVHGGGFEASWGVLAEAQAAGRLRRG